MTGQYDQGGWLPPGLAVVRNDTEFPELVMPPAEEGDDI